MRIAAMIALFALLVPATSRAQTGAGAMAPPTFELLEPSYGNPGDIITIRGTTTRAQTMIEFVDAAGRRLMLEPAGLSPAPAFRIPEHAPGGVATVRVGRVGANGALWSEPHTLVVTGAPMRKRVDGWAMRSVAAGQWTDLVIDAGVAEPLRLSERTDVEFRQDDLVVPTTTLKPASTRVRVPEGLQPGAVSVRVRVTQQGRVGGWSAWSDYEIASRPVSVFVSRVGLDAPGGPAIQLSPPIPAVLTDEEMLTTPRGATLRLRLEMPVADVTHLRVMLFGAGAPVVLTPATGGDERGIVVQLPASVGSGNYRLAIETDDHSPAADVPLWLRIVE